MPKVKKKISYIKKPFSRKSFISVGFAAAALICCGFSLGLSVDVYKRQGVRSTQIMILIWSVVMFTFIQIAGGPMIHIFVDPAQTEVVQAAKDYFTAVAWCDPCLLYTSRCV